MSVDDWARKQAERYAHSDVYGFRAGVASLADAILSDEAVEAAARAAHKENGMWVRLGLPLSAMSDDYRTRLQVTARAHLQAAIDAVTKEARND